MSGSRYSRLVAVPLRSQQKLPAVTRMSAARPAYRPDSTVVVASRIPPPGQRRTATAATEAPPHLAGPVASTRPPGPPVMYRARSVRIEVWGAMSCGPAGLPSHAIRMTTSSRATFRAASTHCWVAPVPRPSPWSSSIWMVAW